MCNKNTTTGRKRVFQAAEDGSLGACSAVMCALRSEEGRGGGGTLWTAANDGAARSDAHQTGGPTASVPNSAFEEAETPSERRSRVIVAAFSGFLVVEG